MTDAGLPLTQRALECARFIQEYTDVHGVSPNYGEIAHEMELKSRSGAHRLIIQLVEKGWATHRPSRERSVKLLQRVPMPIEFMDVRAVAQIAMQAIEEVQRMEDNWTTLQPQPDGSYSASNVTVVLARTGVARDLALRLKAALGNEPPIAITPAGHAAAEVAA